MCYGKQKKLSRVRESISIVYGGGRVLGCRIKQGGFGKLGGEIDIL